jgi:hypothetical protein
VCARRARTLAAAVSASEAAPGEEAEAEPGDGVGAGATGSAAAAAAQSPAGTGAGVQGEDTAAFTFHPAVWAALGSRPELREQWRSTERHLRVMGRA